MGDPAVGVPCVFVDRDGVLVADNGPLVAVDDIVVAPGAAAGLRRLQEAGYKIVVISNQTAVARGLLRPDEVLALQAEIEQRLCAAGAAPLDGFYFCPHHPSATQPEYRQSCACRKPAPGLLLQASTALDLDLGRSVMVGDRASDVEAGRRAGCRTIQVTTGRHDDAPIEVDGGFVTAAADHRCADLAAAADHILLAGGWA